MFFTVYGNNHIPEKYNNNNVGMKDDILFKYYYAFVIIRFLCFVTSEKGMIHMMYTVFISMFSPALKKPTSFKVCKLTR